MDKIQTSVLITHTVIAMLIIALVLIQRGKGADAGAAFGSGASGTVFGARGNSSFFSRMTAILVAVFFATSLGLAYLSGQDASDTDSLIDKALSTPAAKSPADKAGNAADDVTVDGLPALPALDNPDDVSDDAGDLPSLPVEPEATEETAQD